MPTYQASDIAESKPQTYSVDDIAPQASVGAAAPTDAARPSTSLPDPETVDQLTTFHARQIAEIATRPPSYTPPPAIPPAPLPLALRTRANSPDLAAAADAQQLPGGMSPRRTGFEAALNLDPTGIVPGIAHAAEGVAQTATGKDLRDRAAGVHKTIGGVFEAATPAMGEGLLKAPLKTAASVGAGMISQAGVEKGLKKLGMPPEYAAVVGDLAGIFVGAGTHALSEKAATAVKAKYEPILKARAEKANAPAAPQYSSTGTRIYRPEDIADANRKEPAPREPAAQPEGGKPAQPQPAVGAQPGGGAVGQTEVESGTSAGTKAEVRLDAKLPAQLAKAKPRYAYGSKQFQLSFENDLDRAAYITAQKTPSKADAQYLKFAMDATGENEAAIRQHGAAVRAAIKDQAKDSPTKDEDGKAVTLNVADMARKRFGKAESPGEPAQPGAVRTSGALPESPAAAPKPGTIAELPTSSIAVDPVRFQFKRDVGQKGVGEELKGIETFNPELGGIISVWHDPADGKTYVINGHHRVELAQRTNHPAMAVRYIDAATAAEARAKGALINIAEGRGTPIDAAKLFRDMNYTPEDLKRAGISLKGSIAKTGMGLARLDPEIFNLVAAGEIPAETASVIGEMLPDRPTDQKAVIDSIDKSTARGKRPTPAEIRESIRVGMRPDQEITETQDTLFGTIAETRSLFSELGEVSEYVHKQLAQEKRLFGAVSSEASAQRLGGAGNVINAEANASIAQSTKQAQEVYDKLSGMAGPVSDALREGARELAAGGDANAIKRRAYEAVRAAISRTLARPEGGVSRGLPPGSGAGSGETGAGEPDLFGSERGAASPQLLSLGAEKLWSDDIAPKIHAAARAVTDSADDILKVLAPTLRDESSQKAGLTLRMKLAELARKTDQAKAALAEAKRAFNRLTAAENYAFIARIEMGKKQPAPELQAIADVLRSMLDERRRKVQELGTGKLQRFYENYFPHVWADPRRAEQVFSSFFSRRPLEGGKSFLKKRTHLTFEDGLAAGLKPVSDNPVDLILLKTREMDKFLMAHETLSEWKKTKLARFVDAREGKAPSGWAKIADPIGTVYGQSVQQIPEFPNAGIWQGLNETIDALGLKHKRGFLKLGAAIGRARKAAGLIETLHGTKMDTVAHEIGHQIDWLAGSGKRFVLEYPDAQTVARLKGAYKTLKPESGSTVEDRRSAREELKSLKGAIAQRKEFAKQLRDLADLREGEKSYTRSREEKMAQLAQMWVGARELFQRTAPKVFDEWKRFLDETPKLHALRDTEGSANGTMLAQPYDVGGLVIRGHYWAPEGAARILNNYLSPGLRERSGIFRALLGVNNVLNQFQLGMSAFHLGFTSIDTTISKAALGYQAIARGKPIDAARFFAETPTAAFTTFMKGDKMLREWYKPGSQGAAIGDLVDNLVTAGGRARMDQMYRTQIGERMLSALRAGNIIGAAVRAPFAGVEAVSNLIMDQVVPRMKLGAFADMARFHLENLTADATFEDARKVLTQDWNSIENRLGEMTYDNLFWSRTVKDLAMLTTRSVGWNLGTLREIGGGLGDIVAQPVNALRGKPVNLNRLSYLLGLVTVNAVMSSLYQYLKTGKGPEETEDYLFPKNGETDEDGRPQRVSWPTYMKDVYHYATQPAKTLEGKVAPIWTSFAEMIHNRDFYETEIRNPDDPLVAQLRELAEDAGKQFVPRAVRNFEREKALGASPATKAEQFVGITAAPADLNEGPGEKLAREIAASAAGEEPRTRANADRRDLRQSLTRSLHAGKGVPQDVIAARRSGALSKKDIQQAFHAGRETSIQRSFEHLGIEDAIRVYKRADPAERKQVQLMFMKKARTAIKNQPAAERAKTLDQVRAAIAGAR